MWLLVIIFSLILQVIPCYSARLESLDELENAEPEISRGEEILRPEIESSTNKREQKKEDSCNCYSGSTTYVRWGKTTCPATSGTTKVYSGRIGGMTYAATGGTSSQLCMSIEPKFANKGSGDSATYIYGTEYQTAASNPFNNKLHDYDAECVICRTRSRGSSIVVNGRNDCPAGWTLEYHGYLMATYQGDAGLTEAICVDVDANANPATKLDLNGNTLHVLQAGCGSLP